jgi:DNA-binding HxlR family transcriptional regulator
MLVADLLPWLEIDAVVHEKDEGIVDRDFVGVDNDGMSVTDGPPRRSHAREILARVGDKWSVYVIHVLGEAGTLRFNELRNRVDGISQRMLTVTLRGMERDGLVTRKVYPEVPPRVEYALTKLGATLRQLVSGLVEWSDAHLTQVDAARATYDARNRPSFSNIPRNVVDQPKI